MYSPAEYHTMQHFISEGAWSAREVMDRIAVEASKSLGAKVRKCLAIDECAIQKKGEHSVGVARQYCGALGKVENCQLGVYGYLCSGRMGTLVDARLYLPKSWTDDPGRCDSVGVPEDCQTFKTKIELALDVIRHQRELGVEFHFVSADSFYGQDSSFRYALDDLQEAYCADVKVNQKVYLQKPKLFLPPKQQGPGRNPTKLQSKSKSISVQAISRKLNEKDWKKITLRIGTKGKLNAWFYVTNIWTWDKESKDPREEVLIIRRDETTKGYEYKYSLANIEMDEQITIQIMAELQAQRFWIEKGFKEAKSEIGMADYQVRGWLAWTHVMAMTLLAMNFVFKEKLRLKTDVPLLSVKDVRDLLIYQHSGGTRKSIEILEIINNRHRRRKKDILLRLKKSG